MNARFSRTIGMMAILAVSAFASTAHATNYTSNVAVSGNWNSSASWSPTGVPGANDNVIIVGADTINVTDVQRALTVTIAADGVLNVGGTLTAGAADISGELEVDTGTFVVTACTVSSGGHVLIDGSSTEPATLRLEGSPPSLVINYADGVELWDQYATLAVAATCSITGTGTMVGRHDDAAIDLVPGNGATATLTLDVLLHGALTIKKSGAGTGNFINNREVRVDVGGATIKLDISLSSIDDAYSVPCTTTYCWTVNASGATLRIDRDATGLEGSFYVVAGATLQVNANVTTQGGLFLGGSVDVNDGCFTFEDYCGGDCTDHSIPFCNELVSCDE